MVMVFFLEYVFIIKYYLVVCENGKIKEVEEDVEVFFKGMVF